MDAPTIQLSQLSISDLQDIKVDQSPYKYDILLVLGDIFGIGDRLAEIEKFIHDPQTLKKLEDFSYDFLTPSAKHKLEGLFQKSSKERTNYLNTANKGFLGLYNWLEGLYFTKKSKEKSGGSHHQFQKLRDASMNEITTDDSLPLAAIEERNTKKKHLEDAKATLKLMENEIEAEPDIKLDNIAEPIVKLANLLSLLFDLGEDYSEAKKLISSNKMFVKKARELRKGLVSREKIDSVRVLLQDPDLRQSLLNENCPRSGTFLLWVSAFVNYWVLLQFLETGEMSLSENAERDARRQESLIIRSHSCILDEFENKLENENIFPREMKNPSIEDLL